ncbi:MAG TPA: hypothetical protein VFG66_05570 [Gemmatimonadales bacterium]|nr:hypothetical protein [Gemmatimonadales bacterium]
MSIREWSLGRVLVISVFWALGVLMLIGWRAFNAFRGVADGGGIVGVSAGLPDLLKLAALNLVPPLAFVVAWVVQRH